MRSFLFVASLGFTAVLLHGCGGGGASCTNAQIDVKTQSIKGTLTSSNQQTVGGNTTKMSTSGPLSVSFSLEDWNVAISGQQDYSGDVPGIPQMKNMRIELDLIFVAKKKTIAHRVKLSDKSTGKIIQYMCGTNTSQQVPDPEVISMLFDSEVKPKLQKAAKCDGNDGTYDSWKVDSQQNLPFSPSPGTTVSENTKATLKMSKDYLIHSGKSSISVDTPATPTTPAVQIEETSNMEVDTVTATGPTAEDLDYSSWQNCSSGGDMHSMLMLKDTHPAVRKVTLGPGEAILKSIVALMDANTKLQQKQKKAVVV